MKKAVPVLKAHPEQAHAANYPRRVLPVVAIERKTMSQTMVLINNSNELRPAPYPGGGPTPCSPRGRNSKNSMVERNLNGLWPPGPRRLYG
jgi:hypothetical protein